MDYCKRTNENNRSIRRRTEKISWTYRITNEEVLEKLSERKSIYRKASKEQRTQQSDHCFSFMSCGVVLLKSIVVHAVTNQKWNQNICYHGPIMLSIDGYGCSSIFFDKEQFNDCFRKNSGSKSHVLIVKRFVN
ncbi:Hypothetical protein CINCED_3A017140 [Cinara cedri]|uniref:Uncharacterized protein n=1 Tax=Cinara cedri TaxID=506608 RepID=A0A5E4N244_9HEMI|nr:Hypothetical protein CINCED_3A017140 [Cinara cedri]